MALTHTCRYSGLCIREAKAGLVLFVHQTDLTPSCLWTATWQGPHSNSKTLVYRDSGDSRRWDEWEGGGVVGGKGEAQKWKCLHIFSSISRPTGTFTLVPLQMAVRDDEVLPSRWSDNNQMAVRDDEVLPSRWSDKNQLAERDDEVLPSRQEWGSGFHLQENGSNR